MRAQFERLAPVWDSMRRPEAFAALERALDALPAAPKRVLDLGTGTGLAAFVAARRFPEAEVVGVDLAPAMVEQARQRTPPELAERVRFEQADAVAAPVRGRRLRPRPARQHDPVLRRARAGDGARRSRRVLVLGRPETPIWVPSERLRRELGAHGFTDFADFEAEGATALLARKADRL